MKSDVLISKEKPQTAPPEKPEKKKETPMEFISSMAAVLVTGLFIITFNIQAFEIPSSSMENTLLIGDHVTDDTGTGFVHTAPGHGREDFEVWMEYSRELAARGIKTTIPYTVDENGAFPLREHTELPEDVINDLVMLKLNAVGLRGAAHLAPTELSGGMARRVALARSIALDPQLILYDEPFTGLDPISFGVIVRLIRELNDSLGATSVIVTHDVQEALGVVDYVYFMAAGRVIAQGRPDEIRRSHEPFVRQFVNGSSEGPVPFHYPAPKYDVDLELASH